MNRDYRDEQARRGFIAFVVTALIIAAFAFAFVAA
jgi:hypothetical protein